VPENSKSKAVNAVAKGWVGGGGGVGWGGSRICASSCHMEEGGARGKRGRGGEGGGGVHRSVK
jgi:hypothetical protein